MRRLLFGYFLCLWGGSTLGTSVSFWAAAKMSDVRGGVELGALCVLITLVVLFVAWLKLLTIFWEKIERLPTSQLFDDRRVSKLMPIGVCSMLAASVCHYVVAQATFPATALHTIMLQGRIGFLTGSLLLSILLLPLAYVGTEHLVLVSGTLRKERTEEHQKPN